MHRRCKPLKVRRYLEGKLGEEDLLEFLMHLDTCQICWNLAYRGRKARDSADNYKTKAKPQMPAELLMKGDREMSQAQKIKDVIGKLPKGGAITADEIIVATNILPSSVKTQLSKLCSDGWIKRNAKVDPCVYYATEKLKNPPTKQRQDQLVLSTLIQSPHQLTTKEIAGKSGVPTTSVSAVVSALVKRGEVKRCQKKKPYTYYVNDDQVNTKVAEEKNPPKKSDSQFKFKDTENNLKKIMKMYEEMEREKEEAFTDLRKSIAENDVLRAQVKELEGKLKEACEATFNQWAQEKLA